MLTNKNYLAGFKVREVHRLARWWVTAELDEALDPPTVEFLRGHQAQGDRVVLLSGTPDFLAAAIAARLGVSYSIGSKPAMADGRYVAGALLRHPYGEEKKRLVSGLATECGVTRSSVSAYGDSISDLPLLAWAGEGFAVRPDTKLKRVADKKGWLVPRQRYCVSSSGSPSWNDTRPLGAASNGNRTVKVLPLASPSLATSIEPSCAATSAETIASPTPRPGRL